MTVAEHTRSRTGGSQTPAQPISRHPFFPAIVALWFGALFGLGSLALRPALVEQLVLATHLDAVLPMAAPPLGATMRILLALAMTGLGGAIGFVIARRVAMPAANRVDPREAAAPEAPATGRRRSFTAQPDNTAPAALDPAILDVADLDPDGFDAAAPVAAAPAIPARESASGTFVTPPLAAADPVIEDEEPAACDDTVSLDHRLFESYARDVQAASEGEADVEVDAVVNAACSVDAAPGFALLDAPEGIEREAQVEPADAPAAPVHLIAGARISTAPLAELSPVELLERLAIAMARRREEDARLAQAEADAAAAARDEAIAVVAVEPVVIETAVAHADVSEADDVVLDAHVAVEPLPVAATHEPEPQPDIEPEPGFVPPPPVRFERLALRAVSFEPAQPVVSDAEPAEEEQAAAPEPAIEIEEPVALRVPAALRPVDPLAFDDEDDDALPGYIPPRHIGRAPDSFAPFAVPASLAATAAIEPDQVSVVAEQAAAWADDEIDDAAYALDETDIGDADQESDGEEETLDSGYSSLLSLSRPSAPRQSFIRIDEPDDAGEVRPMVVFPGAEPEAAAAPSAGPRLFDGPARGDAEDTERALRAALATLQRMSGAA